MVNKKKETVGRVIDYIAVSKRFMSSVTDCRVFRSFDTGSLLDHKLLVLTLRLRLSTAKQQQQSGQKLQSFNSSKLQSSPAARQCFELEMSNRFRCLVGAQDPQEEWELLQAAAQAAAHKAELDLPQRSQRRAFALSANTLQKIERKHAAHAALLSSFSAANKAQYRKANNAAKDAVRRDQEQYYKKQAQYAETALKVGNLHAFHKHVRRVFGEQQSSSSAAPTAVLGGADGKQLLQSTLPIC
jgi:hypothetical protein